MCFSSSGESRVIGWHTIYYIFLLHFYFLSVKFSLAAADRFRPRLSNVSGVLEPRDTYFYCREIKWTVAGGNCVRKSIYINKQHPFPRKWCTFSRLSLIRLVLTEILIMILSFWVPRVKAIHHVLSNLIGQSLTFVIRINPIGPRCSSDLQELRIRFMFTEKQGNAVECRCLHRKKRNRWEIIDWWS